MRKILYTCITGGYDSVPKYQFVVSGWLQYFGADNNTWRTPEHDIDIKICLTDNCYVAHTASMMRKSVLVKYRWFNNNTSQTQSGRRDLAQRAISLNAQVKYPAYYREFLHTYSNGTTFRLRLFGKIPLIKIKNNWVQLFEFIPLFKIKWR